MNKRLYLILLAGLSTAALADDQIITPNPTAQTAAPGTAVSININYTTNPVDPTLTGLGLRVHFDSSKLTFVTSQYIVTLGQQPVSGPTVDAADNDGDPSTDQFIILSWLDLAGNWPGNVPTTIAAVNFTTTAGFNGTTSVNFSASSTPPSFVLAPTSATISEIPATVSISATNANASEAGPTDGEFTITRSGSTAAALTVNHTTSGTATSGTDYTALSGSTVIPSGASSAQIPVSPIDDALVESTETVIATLSASADYSIGTSNATVNIADNDNPPIITGLIGMTAAAAQKGGGMHRKAQFSAQKRVAGNAAIINIRENQRNFRVNFIGTQALEN
jgi:hypothetical protein